MYADLVLLNGQIITLYKDKPLVEALAIKGNKIIKIGRNEEISQHINEKTKVIDLDGKTVIPGLIDSHIHVADFAKTLCWINLERAKSIAEIKSLVKKHAERAPKGKWIIGKGWDEEKLVEKRPPKASELDEVAPNNPVVLYKAKGRVCVVNSLALEIAGKSENLKDFKNNGVDVDIDPQTGKPTGILSGQATDIIWKLIPDTTAEELKELIETAFKKILEAGITTVQWIVSSAQELYAIKGIVEKGKPPIRVYLIVPIETLTMDVLHELKLMENEYFKVGGAILYADGYLASKTAALTEPYRNSQNVGKLFYNAERMKKLLQFIGKTGLQAVIHAMGDRAVKEALKAIKAVSTHHFLESAKFRIESAAILPLELIEEIASLGLVVSIQPYMAYSELEFWGAAESIGERIRWLYPLKSLVKEGVIVAGGTDCPMEPLNIFSHIKTAVTRKKLVEEQITVNDALRMYTINAAYSMGEHNSKGTIEEGKLADLTGLSENPLTVPPEKIDRIKAELTIVDGEIAYFESNSIKLINIPS
jgi:predicted amidohydrolase YtcJ